mmetsp:Transcript_11252/g.26067  ORF Transcript_11252/g.26067 Transcript_11252/m.26067 type:complete len:292 (-) Transcript_11252:90-965(-)
MFTLHGRDHGTYFADWVHTVSDWIRCSDFHHFGLELLLDGFLDINALKGTTYLPCIVNRECHGILGSLLQVSIREYNHGVLPSEFQHGPFQGWRSIGQDLFASCGATRHSNHVHKRVGHELFTNSTISLRKLDHIRRQNPLERLHSPSPTLRSDFRRFDNHRVASCQGWQSKKKNFIYWKVPWAHNHNDTNGLPDHGAVAMLPRLLSLEENVHVVALVRREFHLLNGFCLDLSHLLDHLFHQRFSILPKLFQGLPQFGYPVCRWQTGPQRKCSFRTLHHGFDLFIRATWNP